MRNKVKFDLSMLIVVPHFFNTGAYKQLMFGSHEARNASKRNQIIEHSKQALENELNSNGIKYDLVYLGIKESNLMNLQVYVEPADPRFLPWIAFDFAYSQIAKYDFVMILEDDIEIESGTLTQLLQLYNLLEPNDALIPNRIEVLDGIRYCTDLVAMPGWKRSSFNISSFTVREPINIHSGFLLMGREKFKSAYEQKPFEAPTLIIGDYMASAFANMHSNFRILRSIPVTNSMTVLHHDNWAKRMIDNRQASKSEIDKRIQDSFSL